MECSETSLFYHLPLFAGRTLPAQKEDKGSKVDVREVGGVQHNFRLTVCEDNESTVKNVLQRRSTAIGPFREIKSSNEVLADELLRADAKFLARTASDAEKLAEKYPDGPAYKPVDLPSVSPLVIRRDGGDAVVKEKPVEQNKVIGRCVSSRLPLGRRGESQNRDPRQSLF